MEITPPNTCTFEDHLAEHPVAPPLQHLPFHCWKGSWVETRFAPLPLALNCFFVGGLVYSPHMCPGHNSYVAVVVCAVRVYMCGCACQEEQKEPTDE